MELARLKSVLRPLVVALKDAGTHTELPTICERLGLPSTEVSGSKRERLLASFESVLDNDVPKVAQRLLEYHPPDAATRNQIQELLWSDFSVPEVPKRYRRDLARSFSTTDLFINARGFDALLDKLWILDDDPLAFWSGNNNSLRNDIERHVHRNPDDWTAEELFERLGAFDASDARFKIFLEGLTSCDVRPDEKSQRQFVDKVNLALKGCSVEMREVDTRDGYPVFALISARAYPMARPKNLIFASSVKPDLRFRDAVSNDIEIVTNADKVLVYDRPIGMDGLRWRELQEWWSAEQRIADPVESKQTLYRRLLDSLPQSSPPQALLFDSFYRGFSTAVPDLPALLPEVWLHWDPKTVKERGRDALFRFRMDFLLLLPTGARVVIEVDGKHHYAQGDRADSSLYAAMVAADRDLQLAGYHVFRFGAAELQRDDSRVAVKEFFESLFKLFGVTVPIANALDA